MSIKATLSAPVGRTVTIELSEKTAAALAQVLIVCIDFEACPEAEDIHTAIDDLGLDTSEVDNFRFTYDSGSDLFVRRARK